MIERHRAKTNIALTHHIEITIFFTSKDIVFIALCRNKRYLCVGINVGINDGIADGINHVQTTFHHISQGHQSDC